MNVYTVITFAPVQGFISKSRKLRDLYGGSFIISYLARTICDAAEEEKFEVVSPATIKFTQGTPNQIVIEGETAFHQDGIEPKFNEAWQKLVKACREEIEDLVPRDDYGWQRNWKAWGNYAWEFFCAEGKEGESITDVREKLNEIKRSRNWVGINWVGESSTLSGTDAVAWPGMSAKTHPKEASMGQLDDEIRDFYSSLSKALGEDKGIVDSNEQLSIPELIKRMVTLSSIKKRLKDENLPQIENPESFKDISRKNNEENRWTGWFQGDGDKIGEYLKSLISDPTQKTQERDNLKSFSEAMIKWGRDFEQTISPSDSSQKYQLPLRSPLTPLEKGGNQLKVPLTKGDLGGSTTFQKIEGRVIYAGGDDFLGVFYRNYDQKLTGKECLEWFYTFPEIWSRHQQPITVSVGLVWAGGGVPQRDVLAHCQEAEQSAKKNGRDRLAIRILFNSGNSLEWVCPWWCLETIMSSDVNWTNFYRDVATLESRYAISSQTEVNINGQKEVAISLFNLHFYPQDNPDFKEQENRLNLADSTYWFNNSEGELINSLRKGKTGILGERKNYEKEGHLEVNKVDNALSNWVINLAKVGFHLFN